MTLLWINFPKDCNVNKILRVSIKEQCEIFLLSTWPRRTKVEKNFFSKLFLRFLYSILALSDANQLFEFCRCQFYVKANFAESYLHQKQWQWHHEKNAISVDQAHFDTFCKINFRWLKKYVSLYNFIADTWKWSGMCLSSSNKWTSDILTPPSRCKWVQMTFGFYWEVRKRSDAANFLFIKSDRVLYTLVLEQKWYRRRC